MDRLRWTEVDKTSDQSTLTCPLWRRRKPFQLSLNVDVTGRKSPGRDASIRGVDRVMPGVAGAGSGERRHGRLETWKIKVRDCPNEIMRRRRTSWWQPRTRSGQRVKWSRIDRWSSRGLRELHYVLFLWVKQNNATKMDEMQRRNLVDRSLGLIKKVTGYISYL